MSARPAPSAPARSVLARVARLNSRQRLLGVLVILAAAGAFVYGPMVTTTGPTYDDWRLRASMEGRGGSLTGIFEGCNSDLPGARSLGCVYHTLSYWAFGNTIRPYLLLGIALLILLAAAGYAVLTRLGWAALPSLTAMLLFIFYPGSDSTRFWITAAGAQALTIIFLAGVLAGVAAVRSDDRGRARRLHALASLAYITMCLTYELFIALTAVTVIFYFLARPGRVALVHGAVDLATALVLAFYRVAIYTPPDDDGFVEGRDLGEWVDRVWVLVEGAWDSWQNLMVPGTAGAVVILVALATIAVALWSRPDARPAIRRDLVVAAAAALFALAGVAAFLTANDFYVPVTYSLFNRINATAALGYCVLTAALLTAWVRAGAALGARWPVFGAAAVAFVLLVVNLTDTSRAHLDSWQESWRETGRALVSLRAVAPSLPKEASVVTFGHPIWQAGFIPVFSSDWDVRGAIDVETVADPKAAIPFLPSIDCGENGLEDATADVEDFEYSRRMYFVNTALAQARPVRSQAACRAVAAEWGRPPFFGLTGFGDGK